MAVILTAAPFPSLLPLTHRLRQIFHAQARDVLSHLSLTQIRNGARADLTHWNKPMLDWLRPVMAPYWRSGLVNGRQQLRRVVMQERGHKAMHRMVRKDADLFLTPIRTAFDLANPSVLEQIDQWTFTFCADTNATAVGKLNEAFAQLRRQLSEGVPAGESYLDIGKRVATIFTDPSRANLIAVTETVRALNGGEVIMYRESGAAEGVGWSTTTNPCPKICEPLDGQERPFGEPFVILNSGPAVYRIVYHAPAHPRCECRVVPVIAL